MSRWTLQLLTLVSTLVVARTLNPADYGIVGMSAVYVGFASMLAELGFTAAIIQRRDMDSDDLASLATIALCSGVLLFAISLALAIPIAAFYRTPALATVICVASFGLIIASVKSTSVALMARDFQFKRLAALGLIEGVSLSLLTLILALAGFGHWSLILGGPVSGIATTAIALHWRPYALGPPRIKRIRAIVTFSSHVVVARIAWYLWASADLVIIGRLFGSSALGSYSFASLLANAPLDRIVSVIGQVTPSVFSAVQKEVVELRRYFLRLCGAVSLLTFPLSVGLVLVADVFVLAVLGDKWSGAVLPMRLLAAYASLNAIAIFANQIILAAGRSDLYMRWALLGLLVLPPLFYLGSYWGSTGVAAAWIVGFPVATGGPAIRSAMGLTHATAADLWRSLLPALRATAMMTLCVLITRCLVVMNPRSYATLVVLAILGAVSYLATLLMVDRDVIAHAWGAVSGAGRRRPAER